MVLVAAHVVVLLTIQIVFPQDLNEVTHHGRTQGRKGLTADGHHLARVVSTIMKNNPEQDVIRLPAPSSSLLYCDSLVAPQ